jgi:hypothetical protein
MGNFVKSPVMAIKTEDLDDQGRYRHLLTLPYGEIAPFVIDYVRRRTAMTIFFWAFCFVTFGLALTIRINVSHFFEFRRIFLHTLLGLVVLPVLIIPVHELMHVIPYFLSGAKRIRIGMDLKQYIFYVTAHRYVASPLQFRLVAICPFIIITLGLLFLALCLPGLWKWSISLLIFVHTTMCAGDFAMLNYYHINRHRKIYTWDDADLMEAYFYEEI